MVEPFTPEPLFFEAGASWYWVLAGPIAAATMLAIEVNSGNGPQLLIPVMFLVLVSGFLAVQVKAARIHTSVELTRNELRQGAETIDVADIVRIFPEPERGAPGRPESARRLRKPPRRRERTRARWMLRSGSRKTRAGSPLPPRSRTRPRRFAAGAQLTS